MADGNVRLIPGLAEFSRNLEKPVNLQQTSDITADKGADPGICDKGRGRSLPFPSSL